MGADEAEEFLQLLCTVFDLDYGRAHAIFFTEPLFDLKRKWALFDEGRLVSILTTVSLEFGWGKGIGIAGVATALDAQRQGYATELLRHVIAHSEAGGEGRILLFAKDQRVYGRIGFQPLDEVIRADIAAKDDGTLSMDIDYGLVRRLYDEWSCAKDCRLRRDELRWKYWRWNLRVCAPVDSGYYCMEGSTVREAVVEPPPREWIMPKGNDWFGLRRVADQLQLPLRNEQHELYLMGYNFPAAPEMFMTDQF